MTPNIADIIRHHVSLEVCCIDRLYLHAYTPKLQTSGGLCYFLRDYLGRVFKVPVEGGAPVRLVAGAGFDPVWSPNGNLIVFTGDVVAASAPLLAVRPDGASVDLPAIQLRTGGQRHRFLPNAEGLIYMQGDGPSQDFWLLDLRTRQSRLLTRLANSGSMQTFDVTPDGKHIVFDRLRDNSDIVLIDLR